MLGDNKIKMSKRLSFSSSIRLRSIRYRINCISGITQLIVSKQKTCL